MNELDEGGFEKDSEIFVPDDVLGLILVYIGEPVMLVLLRRVSQQFYYRGSDKKLWRNMCLRKRPFLDPAYLDKRKNLFQFYFTHIFPDKLKGSLVSEKIMLEDWNIFQCDLYPVIRMSKEQESLYVVNNESETLSEEKKYECLNCECQFSMKELEEEGLKLLCTEYEEELGDDEKDALFGYCSKECFNSDISDSGYFVEDDLKELCTQRSTTRNPIRNSFDEESIQISYETHLEHYYGKEGLSEFEWGEKSWTEMEGKMVDVTSSAEAEEGEDMLGCGFQYVSFGGFYVHGFFKEEREEIYKLLDPEDTVYKIGKFLISCSNRMTYSQLKEFVYFFYKD